MRSLKIYLCDLTYDTITLSTDAFPLNVGYIASYAKKQFQNKLEITIFKYIDKLESALESNPPDIIGFSNYAWNRQISKEMSKIFLTVLLFGEGLIFLLIFHPNKHFSKIFLKLIFMFQLKVKLDFQTLLKEC